MKKFWITYLTDVPRAIGVFISLLISIGIGLACGASLDTIIFFSLGFLLSDPMCYYKVIYKKLSSKQKSP
jgi:hypothetical protein